MNYCQFHPITAATWNCPYCEYSMCDSCIDEGNHNNDHRCMACNTPVESLGSANSATPFWRRLEESFRYPVKGDAIAVIVGTALLEGVASHMPMGFLFQLLLAGIVFSYSFECLKQTALGNMVAPDITSAYGKGIDIMLRLLLILMAMGMAVSGVYQLLGEGMASLLSCLLLLALPAVIILYGLSESIMEALNPRAIVQMITAIGMPYGLILAFIMIMASSVGIIHELLESYSLVSSLLQSITSNFYMIVIFHIMGYMIFQNQGELGYTARENHGREGKARTDMERLKSRIQVLLKEGRYEEMTALYVQLIKANPDDKTLVEECFKFLISTNNLYDLEGFTSFYLEFLIKNRHEDQLCAVYKRVALVMPDYLPDTAELCHTLANSLFQRGDFRAAAKMLHGLHSRFPAYAELDTAYTLMAQCLEAMPNMQAQAEKYREFARKLASKKIRG